MTAFSSCKGLVWVSILKANYIKCQMKLNENPNLTHSFKNY